MTRAATALLVAIVSFALVSPSISQEKQSINLESQEKAIADIKQIWLPANKARENKNLAAAMAHEEKAMAFFVSELTGKQIDWIVKVNAIDKYGIRLVPGKLADKKNLWSVNLHPDTPNKTKSKTTKPLPFSQWLLTPPDEPWVMQLKSGDSIRVQGKVARVERNKDASTLIVGLMMAEYKITAK